MARDTLPKSIYDEPPPKHVLLLSCMDTRLLDNAVHFMNQLNLQNRYDQLIFAGSAMGARLVTSTPVPNGPALPWKAVFFDHLATAINVLKRDIKDILLLEHLDCGAYQCLHPDTAVQKEYKRLSEAREFSKMVPYHDKESRLFKKEIEAFCKVQHKAEGSTGPGRWKDIHVRSLVMDLVGRVTEL